MIKEIIQTIKSKNYSEISEAILAVPALAENPIVLEAMQQIIADHKALTTAVYAIIAQQLKEASGLFNALKNCEPLFPDFPIDLIPPSEDAKLDDVLPENPLEEIPVEPKCKKTKKPAKKIAHSLDAKQLTCACCGKKMHRAHKKTVTIIRMTEIIEERHEIETARCLNCDTKVEADSPNEKTICQFTLPAAAVVIALRYVYGLPSFRMEEVTASFGYRIPDSTQWDIFETAANEMNKFYQFLKKTAADGKIVQMDDTSVRINSFATQFRINKESALEPVAEGRTGLNTTGFISKFSLGRICLFSSGLHHAGEFFEKIMQSKSSEDSVILMMDASSSNTSRLKNLGLTVVQANCNSHAVRKWNELSDNPVFAEDIEIILALYKEIFERDKILKLLSMEERLKVHREKSLPQMEEIKKKIEQDFLNRKVEPTSELGRAYKYFLNHFEKLCAFCLFLGAPICNNECERLLKRAIRHRKNSLFFKNLVGAAVGDIHMTILITAKENGIEPVRYLTDLLTFKSHCDKNPEAWLPWNYPQTILELRKSENPA